MPFTETITFTNVASCGHNHQDRTLAVERYSDWSSQIDTLHVDQVESVTKSNDALYDPGMTITVVRKLRPVKPFCVGECQPGKSLVEVTRSEVVSANLWVTVGGRRLVILFGEWGRLNLVHDNADRFPDCQFDGDTIALEN